MAIADRQAGDRLWRASMGLHLVPDGYEIWRPIAARQQPGAGERAA